MNLKSFLNEKKEIFLQYWESKLFRVAFIVHFFYFALSIILFYTITYNQNDFLTYFNVGKQVITDLPDLYNEANYDFPFRYFPISAFVFVPFYLLGYDLGFIVFQVLNLATNYFICVLMVKCIKVNPNNDEISMNKVAMYVSIFLTFIPNAFNYILGQINLFVALFLLLSIYLLLTKDTIFSNFLAGIFLGLSITIKPIAIFIIPFVIPLTLDIKAKQLKFDFKTTVVRLLGTIFPLVFNILFFLLIPGLWEGFLFVNFLGSTPTIVNHSFSVTRLIVNAFYTSGMYISSLYIFIAVLFAIGITTIVLYFIRKNSQFNTSHAFSLGLLVMLLVYFDSWDHHLIILCPIISITVFHSSNSPDIFKKYVKSGFLGLGYFTSLFVGVWFLIHEVFPFNFVPTICLLLCLYGLIKFALKKDK
jgi:hypothetical protein